MLLIRPKLSFFPIRTGPRFHSPSFSCSCSDFRRTAFNSQKTLHFADKSCTENAISKDGPASPSFFLGERWRELHGLNDWDGLLDPLDGNLRREIVKYGDFVQATYNAMDFDPHSQNYGCCKFSDSDLLLENAGLGSSGYRVTKNLFTNSEIQLPDLIFRHLSATTKRMLRRSSWVGFVAVCDDPTEIRRLGRRDIVVALRGTVTPLEWIENLNCSLVTIDPRSDAKAANGFWRLFTTPSQGCEPSMAEALVSEIQRLRERHVGEDLSVTIAGHSLGAALAVLAAHTLTVDRTCGIDCPPTVISFGGPHVGNVALGRQIYAAGGRVLRVVNENDVVTRLPGLLTNENFGSATWHYSHVGRELRVKTRNSPYLRAEAERDMNCCHDLEAYLHLVDGFLSSTCPFRSTATRDILRLFINQKSNVVLHKPHEIHRKPAPSGLLKSLFPYHVKCSAM